MSSHRAVGEGRALPGKALSSRICLLAQLQAHLHHTGGVPPPFLCPWSPFVPSAQGLRSTSFASLLPSARIPPCLLTIVICSVPFSLAVNAEALLAFQVCHSALSENRALATSSLTDLQLIEALLREGLGGTSESDFFWSSLGSGKFVRKQLKEK